MNHRAAAAAHSLSTMRGVPETVVGADLSSGFSTTTVIRTATQTIVKTATRTNTKTVVSAVTKTVTGGASATGSLPDLTVPLPFPFSSRLQPALGNTIAAISEPLRHAGSQICNALSSATRHLPPEYQLPPEYLALVIAAGYIGAYMGGSVSALLRSRHAAARVPPQVAAKANAGVVKARSQYVFHVLNNMAEEDPNIRGFLDQVKQKAIQLETTVKDNKRVKRALEKEQRRKEALLKERSENRQTSTGNNEGLLEETAGEDVSSAESSLPARENFIDRVVNQAFQWASPTPSRASSSSGHVPNSHKRRFVDESDDYDTHDSPEPKRRRPSPMPSQTPSPTADTRKGGATDDSDHDEGTRHESQKRHPSPPSPKRKSTADQESDDEEETPRQRKKARKSSSPTTSSSGEENNGTNGRSYMTDRQIDARFMKSMTNLEPSSEDEVQEENARSSPKSGSEMMSHEENNERSLPIDGSDVEEEPVPSVVEKEDGIEWEESQETSKNSDSLPNPDDTPTPRSRNSKPGSNLFSTLLPRPKTPDSRKISVKKDITPPTAVRIRPNPSLDLSSMPNLAAPTTFRTPKNISYTA